MGFNEEINLYLKLKNEDIPDKLEKGKLEEFVKADSRIFPGEEISTFLINEDWTPLAIIKIRDYHKYSGMTTGNYYVEKVLNDFQRVVLGDLFREMYSK